MTDETIEEAVESGIDLPPTPDDFVDVDEGDLLPMHPAHRSRKSAAPQLNNKERRKRAVQLRLSGVSFPDIARECGYASAATASAAVRSEVKVLAREEAGELRSIQYERLNMMLLVLQPQVMVGDKGAINTALQIMDRINGLMGVTTENADPSKGGDNYLVVIQGDSDQYIEGLKQMAGYEVPESMLPAQEIPANVVEVDAKDIHTKD